MRAPRIILDNGTKVNYKIMIEGEPCFYTGTVVGNGMDNCMYRTFRDLVYYIIEDGKEEENKPETVDHENVQEIILCPNCDYDMLEEGVDEQVYVTKRYDTRLRKQITDIAPVTDDRGYNCAYCSAEISIENTKKLRKYLDI